MYLFIFATAQVRSIHVNEYYNGSFGLHAADVAVLVLENDVNISDTVAPVCVDYNDTYANAIPNRSAGKVSLSRSNRKIFNYSRRSRTSKL